MTKLVDAGVDVMTVVMEFLDLGDLERMSSVCKVWNYLFNKRVKPTMSQIEKCFRKGHLEACLSIYTRKLVTVDFHNYLPFLSFCRHGAPVDFIDEMVTKHDLDVSMYDNKALVRASGEGHLEIVKYLLSSRFYPCKVNPAQGSPIFHAGRRQKKDVVDFLMTFQETDLSIFGWSLYRTVCHNGYVKAVKKIIHTHHENHRNKLIGNDFNEGFLEACKHDQIEVVKILLKDSRCDPSYRVNAAIRIASARKSEELMKILVKSSKLKNPAFFNTYGRYNSQK